MKGGAGITAGRDVTIGDNTGQQAIGEYINQFQIQQPSGEALIKLIQYLDEKRQVSVNLKILNSYSPSTLPDYPPRLREFVTENRVHEINQALVYLNEHRILFISGVGGIGKTTLAQALVETRPANVPLPFWFDFGKRPGATLGDVLEQLAGYMNAPLIAQFMKEGREAGQYDINRLTDELGKRDSPWLIFDNLETALNNRNFHDPGIDSLFTSLRDSTHQAKIIITSRTLPVLADGGSLIDILEDDKHELKGLKTNFAVDYLIKNGLDEVELSKLKELALGIDGHPMALKLLIELVKKFGVDDTLNDTNLYKKRKEDTIKKAKRLFDKLAGEEKELLGRISVFRNPESISAIKKMYTENTSIDAIEKLVDKSLIETDHKGKYWLHPLVREFSYDDLEKKSRIHKIACSYYLSIPVIKQRQKKEDIQSLIEAHYHACMAKEYETAASIIITENIEKDLDVWGNYSTLVEIYNSLLPEDHFKDKPLLNYEIHSTILLKLGNIYIYVGEVEKAIKYLQASLSIFQDINDKRGQAGALGKLGNAFNSLGDVNRAIRFYEDAIEISKKITDKQNESVWIAELGNVYHHLGNVEKAIVCYQNAIKISQEIGDKINEGCYLGNLGNAYIDFGNLEKSIEYHQKSLKISREIGDKHNEGNWLGNLGLAYHYLNNHKKAIEYYQDAIKISREIGNKGGEGVWIGNLGLVYISCLDTKKGIKYCDKSLRISQEIGDLNNVVTVLGSIGEAYFLQNEIDKAIEYYKNSLDLTQKIHYRQGEGFSFVRLGRAYLKLNQIDEAINYFKKGLMIGKEVKNSRIINTCEEFLKSLTN